MAWLDWPSATSHLASATTKTSLRARLLTVADALGPQLIGMGTSTRAWTPLGVRVVQRTLNGISGHCELSGRNRVVHVHAADDPRRQRFTVAHELGHLLMADVDRALISLSRDSEESLANEFAQRLLVPSRDLFLHLVEGNDDIETLLAVCSRYSVTLSVALATSGPWFAGRGYALFAASSRAHPERPDDVTIRAYSARCGDIFIPDLITMTSMGLDDAADLIEAIDCERDDAGHGFSTAVEMPLWRPNRSPRSGVAHGRARWCMRTMRTGVTIVRLNTRELTYRWWSPRESTHLAAA